MFSTSRVNLKQIQDAACAELSKLLDHHIDGNKLIVMDEFIMGPLNLVTNTQYFSERNIKLMKLGSDLKLLPAREFPNVIFLVRPQVHVMELIYQLFKHSENDTKGRIYHLFFVPRRSCVCMKYLENKGVYGKFSMNEELPWNFYVLDTDVLSMELPNAFKDLTVNGDPTVLYQAALGLISIQKHFGCIPKIYGKGNYAQRIWEFAKQLGREEKVLVSSGGEKGFIDQLIILDRSTDVLSALATQLTYQGLIDDFYGIKQNQVKLPAVVFSRSSSSNDTNSSSDYSPTLVASEEMRSIILNSSDKLYLQLRDKNFNEVGRILTRNAKEISQQMNPSDKDKMHVMKQLVDNLQSLLAQKQSVGMHTTIAEQIRAQLDDYAFSEHLEAEQDFMVCKDNDRPSPYIEDLIAQKEDLKNVLRLMCIQCVASSGFKDKVCLD